MIVYGKIQMRTTTRHRRDDDVGNQNDTENLEATVKCQIKSNGKELTRLFMLGLRVRPNFSIIFFLG